MCNEELALLIQQGDNGAVPLLWEQVRRLIAQMAIRYYNRLDDNKRGVEVDDLIQQGYFAVLEAVRYYKPKKGYMFTTYLTKTLKRAFRTAVGTHTSKRDMLDYTISLDEPIGESEDSTLLDMVADMKPDNAPVNCMESVYNQELHQALDNALQLLTETQRDKVRLHYYFGLSYERIAAANSISRQCVDDQIYRALNRIKHSSHKRLLLHFLLWYMDEWALTDKFLKREVLKQ